jgi:ankyrin repeat protein
MSDALPLPPRPNLEQYRNLARDLQRAVRRSDPERFARWAARWPDDADRLERRLREFVGSPDRAAAFKLTDAQFFLAREHGFASWPAFVAHLEGLTSDSSPVALFESAVEAIVCGDAAKLEALLKTHPELVRARSTRDHHSTLLHYVSANGVEDFRQITPTNIVPLTRLLLDAGADVNAASNAYGGGSTALGLVATSVHPEQRGVQIELLETLLAHGARVEGAQAGNDHGVVLGCLANGQPAAARFFADRGAPLNLVEAAGVGRLDRVRAFFDEHGQSSAAVAPGQIDTALQYAAGYGRPDVVTFLIDRGARVTWADDRGQTPLHWATFGPHVEVTRILLANGASVNARDRQYNATPLDWMIHALATNDEDATRTRGREVVALLVAAGAVPDLDRFGAAIRSRLLADAGLVHALRLTPIADTSGGTASADASTLQLEIQTPEINLCSLSSDGRTMLVAAQGNPVATFDASTGKRTAIVDASSVNAWLASWTPDPNIVLVGSRDQTIGVWNIERNERVAVLRGHHGLPRAASTDADGTRVVTGCSHRDTSIKLWDLRSGECLRTLEGHADGVYSLAFRGGDQVASGSRDTTIRLWDLTSGATLRVLTGHTYHVHSLAWSRDHRRLLSSSMDIRLWDADTGHCLRIMDAHTMVIRTVVWSPDESLALSASHDGTARLWEVDSGRCVRVFEAHHELVAASFSANGRRVITCDSLGAIRSWPLEP